MARLVFPALHHLRGVSLRSSSLFAFRVSSLVGVVFWTRGVRFLRTRRGSSCGLDNGGHNVLGGWDQLSGPGLIEKIPPRSEHLADRPSQRYSPGSLSSGFICETHVPHSRRALPPTEYRREFLPGPIRLQIRRRRGMNIRAGRECDLLFTQGVAEQARRNLPNVGVVETTARNVNSSSRWVLGSSISCSSVRIMWGRFRLGILFVQELVQIATRVGAPERCELACFVIEETRATHGSNRANNGKPTRLADASPSRNSGRCTRFPWPADRPPVALDHSPSLR